MSVFKIEMNKMCDKFVIWPLYYNTYLLIGLLNEQNIYDY